MMNCITALKEKSSLCKYITLFFLLCVSGISVAANTEKESQDNTHSIRHQNTGTMSGDTAQAPSIRRLLANMFTQIEVTQRNIQILRQQIELLDHNYAAMQARIRELAVEFDNRLAILEQSPKEAKNLEVSDPSIQLSILFEQLIEEDITYQAGIDALLHGQFSEAVDFFQQFIDTQNKNREPSHLIENAHFWLGEALYHSGKFLATIEHVDYFLENFPSSARTIDVQLRQVDALVANGNIPEAIDLLESLQHDTTDEQNKKRIIEKRESISYQ